MRRFHRSKKLSAGDSFYRHSQFWIILLLVVLVILSIIDLLNESEKPAHLSQPMTTQSVVKAPVESKPITPPPPQPAETKPQVAAVTAPPIQPTITDKSPSPAEIRVQILNGSGVRGLADRVRTVLKDRGYLVKSYGNAERQNYQKSTVVIRAPGTWGGQAGKLVAQSLGITLEQISTEADPSLKDIDVTVILGRDYRQLKIALE